jgi:hypothetical protein
MEAEMEMGRASIPCRHRRWPMVTLNGHHCAANQSLLVFVFSFISVLIQPKFTIFP